MKLPVTILGNGNILSIAVSYEKQRICWICWGTLRYINCIHLE